MELKLYEITGEYLGLLDEVMHNEGEITPDLEQALQINEDNMKSKFENYAKFIRSKKSIIDIRKAEIARINKLIKTDESLINNLESRISQSMLVFEKDKVETELFKFSFRKSESVEVFDEEGIPEEFKKTVTTTSVSKTDIKKYMKDNNVEEIEGARLLKNKNLSIK